MLEKKPMLVLGGRRRRWKKDLGKKDTKKDSREAIGQGGKEENTGEGSELWLTAVTMRYLSVGLRTHAFWW